MDEQPAVAQAVKALRGRWIRAEVARLQAEEKA
jgi:hypothetical protein